MKRPAVFLDRDGTIIEHVHHLASPDDVRVIPGAAEAIARLRDAGYAVVVVTNQSVVGRGLVTADGLDEIHGTMNAQLSDDDAKVEAIYWCDHVPQVKDPTVIEHEDRKPGPGMLRRAAAELDLDLERSWMVGDTISDMLAGRNAGCRGSVLVRTGCGGSVDDADAAVTHASADLAQAADWILSQTAETNEFESMSSLLPQPDPNAPPPFFVVGSERSGTTLFRLILSAHPLIKCHSEFEYVVDYLDPETSDMPISDFRDQLAEHRKFPVLHEIRAMLERDPQIAADHHMVARAFLEQYRREQKPSIVGATVHSNFDRLPRIWSDARFIHIVRDPRDVARSVVKMGWAGSPFHGVHRWVDAEETWERLSAQLDDDRWIDVRYESLIASPESELTRICEFLGVEYSDKMLDYHEASTYDALDPKLTRQWERKMSPRDIRLVETEVGQRLVGRGYEPSGLPPLPATAWQRFRERVRGKVVRWRWRINRYGLLLLVKHVVAKKLRIKGVRERTLRALQDIEQQNLK